jgi:MFS transporter, DHA2 family, multidrug resistance protein
MLISGLMAISNGQEKGWNSTYIHVCEALTVIGLVMFISIELTVRQPILDLKIFLRRNYVLSLALAIFRSVGLFGSIFLLPIFLQTLMGYTTVQAGVWLIPGAIAVGITMPIAGRLADRYNPSLLTATGISLVGVSLILFGNLDPLSHWQILIYPQLIRGVGLALMMAPLLAAALNAVPQHQIPMASSFINIFQNVGGSLGIALLNNYVTNSVHSHAVGIGEAFPMQSQSFFRFAYKTSNLIFYKGADLVVNPEIKAAFAAGQGIMKRAQVLGFNNGFVIAGIIVLLGLPFALALKATVRKAHS